MGLTLRYCAKDGALWAAPLTAVPDPAACESQVGAVRRFIDISVPRNIAPNLNELDGAIVYNVDDLKEVGARPCLPATRWLPADSRQGCAHPHLHSREPHPSKRLHLPPSPLPAFAPLLQVVAANKEERARAAAEAEVLLAEEQLAFEAWRDSLETVPTIKVRDAAMQLPAWSDMGASCRP